MEIGIDILKTDLVFHLAALADIVQSIQKPDDYFRSNVIATSNVINSVEKTKLKNLYILHHLRVMEFQRNIQQRNKQINPLYPCFNKKAWREIILHYSKIYDLNVVSLDFLMCMELDLGFWSLRCNVRSIFSSKNCE